MNTTRACTLVLCAIAATSAPGCGALSAKGDPGGARYFSLVAAPRPPGALRAGAPGSQGEPARLRLGRVTGAPHLEERLVFRNSAQEIGFHRDVRWAEPPEAYLRQLLARELFEVRGLSQIAGGAGPTLDVDLAALDEIRAPRRLARAQVVVSLRDEHRVIWTQTMTVDRPIAETKGGDLAAEAVEGLQEALQAVVDAVADLVVRLLESDPPERNR